MRKYNSLTQIRFSMLKIECVYRHKPRIFQEANDMIEKYSFFYNQRIQLRTGVAPLALRHST